MAEIRLTVPDAVVEALQKKLGPNVKLTEMAKEAMTLFNWAVGESAAGRLILSADAEGKGMKQVAMPTLDAAKPQPKD
jgi:hypothetical protein